MQFWRFAYQNGFGTQTDTVRKLDESCAIKFRDLTANVQETVNGMQDSLYRQLKDIQSQAVSDTALLSSNHERLHAQLTAKMSAFETVFSEAIDNSNTQLKSLQDRTQETFKSLTDFAHGINTKTDALTVSTQESFAALRSETKASFDFINVENLKKFDQTNTDLSALNRTYQAQSQRMGELIKDEISARFSSDV